MSHVRNGALRSSGRCSRYKITAKGDHVMLHGRYSDFGLPTAWILAKSLLRTIKLKGKYMTTSHKNKHSIVLAHGALADDSRWQRVISILSQPVKGAKVIKPAAKKGQ